MKSITIKIMREEPSISIIRITGEIPKTWVLRQEPVNTELEDTQVSEG